MWSRKELKAKSKVRFKVNYWKSVLVALVLIFLVGGGGVGGAATYIIEDQMDRNNHENAEYMDDKEDFIEVMDEEGEVVTTVILAAALLVLAFVIIIVCVIIIPLQVFVFNPLEVGCRRFYVKNLKGDAQAKEMCYAFDNGYKKNVKTLFLRDLYTILWTLLLIIPGIVKAYEYRMIPYILSDDPELSTKEAFALSKKMMYGNKWKAFLLDLSFLGWNLLDLLTLGILGLFYVNPYQLQTEAAFYEAIKEQ